MSVRLIGFTARVSQPAVNEQPGLYYRDGYVGAFSPATKASAAIYDINGSLMLSLSEWNGDPISVTTLGRGVYIFEVNDKTIKFTRP